jgi:hypothetical protein
VCVARSRSCASVLFAVAPVAMPSSLALSPAEISPDRVVVAAGIVASAPVSLAMSIVVAVRLAIVRFVVPVAPSGA